MKTNILAMTLGAALVVAPMSAMAADATVKQAGALAPGSAAGVKTAQDWSWDGNKTAYLLGGAAVVAGVVLIASDNGSHHHGSSSTTTGAP